MGKSRNTDKEWKELLAYDPEQVREVQERRRSNATNWRKETNRQGENRAAIERSRHDG